MVQQSLRQVRRPLCARLPLSSRAHHAPCRAYVALYYQASVCTHAKAFIHAHTGTVSISPDVRPTELAYELTRPTAQWTADDIKQVFSSGRPDVD